MTKGSQPWWYSGDESDGAESDGAESDGPESDGAESEQSERSETSEPGTAEPEQPEPEQSESGRDWTALLLGAQRVVDWATEKVMAPHAEHGDPAEHPQCVVCRTMVLIGEGRPGAAEEPASDTGVPGDFDAGTPDRDGTAPAASPPRASGREIVWIPIREQVPEP